MSHMTLSASTAHLHRRMPLIWRGLTWLAALAIAAFPLVKPVRAAGPDESTEYRIKAAYLYNFTKFIDWPPQCFSATTSPLSIGVLERDAVAAEIIATSLQGKRTPTGRALEVRRFTGLDEAVGANCHILFVTRGAGVSAAAVRDALRGRPVLVVGESEGFAERGGVINFVLSGDVVRFEINPRRAESAGLRVSGSLGSVARLVHDREGG